MKNFCLPVLVCLIVNSGMAQSLSLGLFGASGSGSANGVSVSWSLGGIAGTEQVYAALPVRLVYFQGERVAATTVVLNWKTASETSNAGFEIQKSTDGKKFEMIGWVDGKGDQGGVYQYFDNDLQNISYYRLKQLDYDGAFTFSRIVSVIPLHESVDVFAAYPNPSIDGKVHLRLPFNTTQVTLVDQKGRVISQFKDPVSPQIELSLAQSGTFMVSIITVAESKTLTIVRP